jgi:hypothetical protein
VTRRKPLEWYDATTSGIGAAGKLPGCDKCCDLLLSPGFAEAVYSVSIEHRGSPADLARRTINGYHADRHPAVSTSTRRQ